MRNKRPVFTKRKRATASQVTVLTRVSYSHARKISQYLRALISTPRSLRTQQPALGRMIWFSVFNIHCYN